MIGLARLGVSSICTCLTGAMRESGYHAPRNPSRGVAQLGRARALGARSRRFESCHPDFFAWPAKHETAVHQPATAERLHTLPIPIITILSMPTWVLRGTWLRMPARAKISNSCAATAAQNAHRAARCTTGSVADAKRSTVNAHGEDHIAHPIAQCINLMAGDSIRREEAFNDLNQCLKRAWQMTRKAGAVQNAIIARRRGTEIGLVYWAVFRYSPAVAIGLPHFVLIFGIFPHPVYFCPRS